jgi:hypothetical protein
MGEYPPVMNCTFFGLKYEWVITPYNLMLYTKSYRIVAPDLV